MRVSHCCCLLANGLKYFSTASRCAKLDKTTAVLRAIKPREDKGTVVAKTRESKGREYRAEEAAVRGNGWRGSDSRFSKRVRSFSRETRLKTPHACSDFGENERARFSVKRRLRYGISRVGNSETGRFIKRIRFTRSICTRVFPPPCLPTLGTFVYLERA